MLLLRILREWLIAAPHSPPGSLDFVPERFLLVDELHTTGPRHGHDEELVPIPRTE